MNYVIWGSLGIGLLVFFIVVSGAILQSSEVNRSSKN